MASHINSENLLNSEGITQEIRSAFLDEPTNNQNLADLVVTHYSQKIRVNDLYATPLSELKVNIFYQESSRISAEHVALKAALESIHESFGQKLDRIALIKNAAVVFFLAVAMICVLTSSSVISIAAGALGTQIRSLLNKRERALNKLKETAVIMTMGTENSIKRVRSIQAMAGGLQRDIQSLSRRGAEEVKFECVKNTIDKIQADVEVYHADMKLFKQMVLNSIAKHC